MADPVNNLVALWADNPVLNQSTITVDWDDADDVTTGSTYNIYSSRGGPWQLIATAVPQPVKALGAPGFILTNPSSKYLYTFTSVTPTVMPSIAFRVTHVDSTGVESDPVAVSAFRKAQTSPVAPPHFKAAMGFDGFGQFMVNAQGTFSEIRDSVQVFMGTSKGQRSTNPAYGIDEPVFHNHYDTHRIEGDLQTWEPRATIAVDTIFDDAGNLTLRTRIVNTTGSI